MGTASGLCAVLNDQEEVKKLRSNLKFAASVEEVKSDERTRKADVAQKKKQAMEVAAVARTERVRQKQEKMETLVKKARAKLHLGSTTRFTPRHLPQLPSDMLSAVAFCLFQVILSGKVAEKRSRLKSIMLENADTPDEDDEEVADDDAEVADDDTEVAAEVADGDSSADDDAEVVDGDSSAEETCPDIPFDKLNLGDIVEVYWSGNKEWYEGEVTSVDKEDNTVEVHYKVDGNILWHSEDVYRIRYLD